MTTEQINGKYIQLGIDREVEIKAAELFEQYKKKLAEKYLMVLQEGVRVVASTISERPNTIDSKLIKEILIRDEVYMNNLNNLFS